MRDYPVRILQVQIGSNTFSGVASYLYQYYKHMDHDFVHYDFLFCRENSMELVKNDPALKNSKFYVLNAVRGKSNDYLAIERGVHKILRAGNYDVIVVNTSIIAVIYACMLGMHGIKNTKFITHAHNTDLVLGKKSLRAKFLFISKRLDDVMRHRIRVRSDYLFACTEAAGEMTYGKDSTKLKKFKLIKNAIDTEAFSFDIAGRNRVRMIQETAESTCVYGNVGSFCKRKNQTFLIRVFALIHKQHPDSELWLIGDGKDREIIEDLICRLNLQGAVKLLGQRNDVSELMQAMDCFVFPTLSEGLGIVAIEAQAAGLPTVVSDGVPKDVLITDLAIMQELAKGEKDWANNILKIQMPENRKTVRKEVAKAGFDIQKEAMKITNFFMKL